MAGKPPEHDEVESYLETDSTDEPGEPRLNVSISLPEKIDIRMVEASAFSDYEIWLFSSSCGFTLAVAFWVAWFQEEQARSSSILKLAASIFSVLFLFFFAMTMKKRQKMTKRFKSYTLRTGTLDQNTTRRLGGGKAG